MTELVFELPLPTNVANKPGTHWASRHFSRKRYFEVLDARVIVKGWNVPRPVPGMPWANPSAAVEVRTWRQMDTDNCHARLKPVFDWLQSRGYIVNDRHLTYVLLARSAPRKEVGITLKLREGA